MPKPLVLSNGNLLVGLDSRGQVRDFYFPYVGLENQTGGRFMHRIGVWVDGQFSWFDNPEWSIDINYKPETLASSIKATNPRLNLELTFNDVVYNEKDIFIRKVQVKNLTNFSRQVKVFFHHQFVIHESTYKDTAYFDPIHQVIIHYKGRRVFLINARCGSTSFDDYSVGLFNIENREGTFIDAEDGQLSKNPIEHGQVDSVMCVTVHLEPEQFKVVEYWITAATSIQGVLDLNLHVLSKSPSYLAKTSQDFWHAWTNREDIDFGDLSDNIITLFKKSLLIIRTHVDNRGGILASCDSDMLQYGRDNYSYIWPRDGSLSAIALDKAGDHGVAERFFQFCNSVIHPDGYFMHKYRPDFSLGSSWHPWIRQGKPQLPIQEDETAIVIHALWQHYDLTRDLEFIESIYNSLIKKSAEFMLTYRERDTGLPLPSYDLWEEKNGISTYTAATVFAALTAASKFADLLGKTDSAARYRGAAEEIRHGITTYLYDKEKGYFYKMINRDGEQITFDHTIDISSLYGVFKFGILPPNDDRLTKAASMTLYHLGLTTLTGGIARYEGDVFNRVDPNVPGNPWFISTLWLAQYYLTQVKKTEDLGAVKRLLNWTQKHSMNSGILSEQLNPHTGEQISAAPLTWSHSEFVITVLDYLQKYAELTRSKT